MIMIKKGMNRTKDLLHCRRDPKHLYAHIREGSMYLSPGKGLLMLWQKFLRNNNIQINDRLILEYCHKIEMALISVLSASVFLIKDKLALAPVILIILFIVCMIGLYRVYLYKKLNGNLQAIVQKTKGKFIEGSPVLSEPPQAYFVYQHQDCQVISCVDKHFRLLLEVNCFFGKEREFRVEQRIKRGRTETVFSGKNKDVLDHVHADPHMKRNLDVILQNFSYLNYGKDGVMHAGQSFDGNLTKMDTVFDTLEAMSSIGKYLRLDG